ncbi:hypothetical protein C4D60_Mb06t12820 [Musa balbisiana]|uniref:Ubiquitin-like domain-containing protein n=1 Tax=Musa balbisiana TaxID=52838 RepID=A0A4S8IMM0_MUSBA|nr:hypothetical protein C4D60_Mb06t12820 [Musa balbisiana]
MPQEDLIELKFRLFDGSDIGPIRYSSTSTVAMLKDRIISEWPRDKKIIPEVANDVKLISAGKILENNMTVAQCASPFSELPPAGVITMHVVVQPSLTKTKTVYSLGMQRPSEKEVKELDDGFESRKRTPLNEERGMCPQMERSLVRVNTIGKLSDF